MIIAIFLLIAISLVVINQVARIWIGATRTWAQGLAENLTLTIATDVQDGIANVWTWFFRYQIPSGNVIALKKLRDQLYAMTMALYSAGPVALPDDALIQIVVYDPSFRRMEEILWSGTYATIRQATKYDLETMISANLSMDVQEDYWIAIEVYDDGVALDVSECSIDIGVKRWTPVRV